MKDLGHSHTRGRDWKLAVFVAVCLVVVAFIAGRVTAPETSRPGVPRPQPDVSSDVSSQQSEAGAVEAATKFAQIMAGPSGAVSDYLEKAESIAAPEWQQRSRELARGNIEFVNERYGEDGSLVFEPIRYRVRSYSSKQAVIDIWGVVLGAGPKINGIEESWLTGTLELVWIESEWKVEGQSSEGGPTPEQLRAEEGLGVDEVLDEFNRYGSLPDA